MKSLFRRKIPLSKSKFLPFEPEDTLQRTGITRNFIAKNLITGLAAFESA